MIEVPSRYREAREELGGVGHAEASDFWIKLGKRYQLLHENINLTGHMHNAAAVAEDPELQRGAMGLLIGGMEYSQMKIRFVEPLVFGFGKPCA